MQAGLDEAAWVCRTKRGKTVPNGVCFCRLQTETERISRKAMLAESD